MSNIPTEALFASDYLKLDRQYTDAIISRTKTLNISEDFLIRALAYAESKDEIPYELCKFINDLTVFAKNLSCEISFAPHITYLLKNIKGVLSQMQKSSHNNKLSSEIVNQINMLIKRLGLLIAKSRHSVSVTEGRRDLAFNYLLASESFSFGWQIKSADNLESLDTAFYAAWRIDKHRAKASLKNLLQIKVMPMEISWLYLASSSLIYFLRHRIRLDDLHFRFSKTARAIIDLNILTPQHGAVFELTKKIGNNEVCLIPYDQLSGKQLSSYQNSLKLLH